MATYLLSMYQPDGPIPEPKVLSRIMNELEEINRDLRASGSWVFAGGLHSATSATVVRVKDGETLMTDGPFIEGKEHLGGFSVIRANDLDAAIEWAQRFARATGLPIEVRPFQERAGASTQSAA